MITSRPSDRHWWLLIAALAAAWLAMLLTGGPASEWDLGLAALLYARDRPMLASAAALLTEMGGWIFLTVVTAAAALVLLVRRRPKQALMLLILVLGSRLLVSGQKVWLARARPDPAAQLVEVSSLSFPSGHAANSMVAYLAAALIFAALTERPRVQILLIALALAFAFMIGLSRVMLGVHWPSDVIGGWAFGAAWTLGLTRLFAKGTSPGLRH